MDVSLQQEWTKTQALNVNAPWGPLYTESRQRCSNAGTPDQLGIATHIWSDLLGVLRDQKQLIGAILLDVADMWLTFSVNGP